MTRQHLQFPIGLHTQWQQFPPAHLSDGLKDWLLDPGSLTARLKNQCDSFSVEVLGQHVELCSAAEAKGEIAVGERVLVREVLLICDGRPHVFARSLMPLSTLEGDEQALANLGTQPLGQVLFNHPELSRASFEVGEFLLDDEPLSVFATEPKRQVPSLWGRRSLFYLGVKPLMVAEVFLPEAFAYKEMQHG